MHAHLKKILFHWAFYFIPPLTQRKSEINCGEIFVEKKNPIAFKFLHSKGTSLSIGKGKELRSIFPFSSTFFQWGKQEEGGH